MSKNMPFESPVVAQKPEERYAPKKPEAVEDRETRSALHLAEKVWGLLKQALDQQTAAIEAGETPREICAYLKAIWPGEVWDVYSRERHTFLSPQQWFPEVARPCRWVIGHYYEDTKSCDGSTQTVSEAEKEITVELGGLHGAGVENRKKLIDQAAGVVFHETQHLLNGLNAGMPPDGIEGALQDMVDGRGNPHFRAQLQAGLKIEKAFLNEASFAAYFSNPVEIKAYACQFAIIYKEHFQGRPLKIEYLEQLAGMIQSARPLNWFLACAKREIQQKFDFILEDYWRTDCRKAHQDFMAWMQYFLTLE
jgi:hypothetical protein